MHSTEQVSIKGIADIYPIIGNGRYQVAVTITAVMTTFCMAMQEFIVFFVAFDNGWKCTENSKTCLYNGTILPDDKAYKSRCRMNRSDWDNIGGNDFSIVNEFDLYCGKEYWISMTSTLFYGGNCLGAVIFGAASDRFGRSRTANLCVAMVLPLTFIAAFAPNLWSFEVIRTVTGVFKAGTYMILIVLSTESVSEEYRTIASMVAWSFYALGVATLGAKGYYLQNWRHLLMVCSAPYCFLIILIWFTPESFLWLHARRKEEKLTTLIKRIARINKRKVPSSIVFDWPEKKQKSGSIFLMFNSSRMFFISFPVAFAWFTLGISNYGIALAANDLTGNPYRDFILIVLCDFPATFIAMYCSSRFGRRISNNATLAIGGLCLTVIGVVPETSSNPASPIMRLSLGIIARILTSVSFDIIITWSAELYTTKLRSKSIGFFDVWSLVGGVAAPWAGVWLHSLDKSAPFFTMGGLLVVSAFMLCRIPETRGKELDNDIDKEKITNDRTDLQRNLDSDKESESVLENKINY